MQTKLVWFNHLIYRHWCHIQGYFKFAISNIQNLFLICDFETYSGIWYFSKVNLTKLYNVQCNDLIKNVCLVFGIKKKKCKHLQFVIRCIFLIRQIQLIFVNLNRLHCTVRFRFKSVIFLITRPVDYNKTNFSARKLRDYATFTLSSKYTTVFNQ